MNVFFTRALAATAGLLFALPAGANAASGGVRIIVQAWTPANPSVQRNDIVFDKPGLLGDALASGWALARTPICDALKAELGKSDRIAPGFTLYNMDCRMATSGTLAVTGATGNRVTMTYELPGNMFKATSTQPTVLGTYANPCAFISYDLSATTTLHLDTLAIDAFSATIDHVSRPDSCNAAGDIAKFFATTLHFFGGPDFLAIAQNALTKTQDISTGKLNAAVASFVDPVRKYGGAYAKQQSWVINGNLYFAFAPSYVPEPLSSTMGGTIRMEKRHWLAAAPDCAAFSVIGNVQTGPAPITDPERLSVGAAANIDLGVIDASGTATDAGDRYVCNYTERQLPTGVPIAFRGSGKAGNGREGHVVYAVGFKPDGWSGTTSLNGFTSGKNFIATVAPRLAGFGEKANTGVRVNPGDPATVGLRARVNILTNPVERVGLNPQPLPPKVADTLTQSGNTLFARGDFAGAAAAFERAVGANASNAIALHNLALAHARLGQSERATSELKRASELAKSQGDLGTSRASESAIIIVSGRH